jgi:hypothetical protein
MPSDDDIREIEQLRKDMQRLADDMGVKLTDRSPDEPPLCSFCGAGRNNVKAMFRGQTSYICSDCVTVCQDQLNAE